MYVILIIIRVRSTRRRTDATFHAFAFAGALFSVIFFYRLGDVLSLLLSRLDIFSSRLGKVCEEVRRRYPPIVSGYQTFGLPKMLKLHSFTVPEFPSPLVKSYIRSYIKNVKFLINHKILKKKKLNIFIYYIHIFAIPIHNLIYLYIT